MAKPEHLATIEEALRKGGHLHAFRSGGGLRVLRIEKPRHGELLAYGEHPELSEAFRITADDYKAGGREYGDVYGNIEENYLTGSYSQEDELEKAVLNGASFDAYEKGGHIVFEIHNMEIYRTPEDIVKRASIGGETVTWTDDRGVTRRASPSRFPNGERCCSIITVSVPEGMQPQRDHIWDVVRRATALTLEEALAAAVVTKKEEVKEPDPMPLLGPSDATAT